MQKTIDIMKKAALAVCAAVIATGCIFEKEAMPKDLQSVTVQLNVSSDVMTRAQEDPTAAESALNSVRIYAFHGNRLAGHFLRQTASDDPIFMDLRMPETGVYNVDFYVIANEKGMIPASGSPEISATLTRSQISDITISGIDDMAANGMPMYGVSKVSIDVENILELPNAAAGHMGHTMLDYHVAVELFRPFAKISVYAARTEGNASDIVIEDVIMQARGTRQYGYLMEKEVSVMESIPAGTSDLDMLLNPVILTKTVTESQMEIEDNYDELVADEYLFEVPFGSSAWNVPVADDVDAVVLDVSYLSGGSSTPTVGTVYMPEIERNTHYKVYCHILSEREVEMIYIVRPWTEEIVEVPEYN